MPYGFGPHISAEVGSDAATCHTVPDLASQLRWTPTLPRVLWLWTSLSVEVGFDATTCPTVSDLAS
jgi:hypothetical protein